MLFSHFMKLILSSILIFSLSLSPPVFAHRPLLSRPSCDNDFSSPDTALLIPDPTISWSFKHFADCSARALWMSFINPEENFIFYVGSGVPTESRFADLRVDGIIIGPGLPELSDDDKKYLESTASEVKKHYDILSTTTSDAKYGALLFRSPVDQSSCAHLGPTMTRSSEVRNGRCDFYEPYGRTNSWRVLDADENKIPKENENYFVATFLQSHVSGKYGVAVGTWRENFYTNFEGYPLAPNCERDISNYSEQHGAVDGNCFPVVQCKTIQCLILSDSGKCVARKADGSCGEEGSDKKSSDSTEEIGVDANSNTKADSNSNKGSEDVSCPAGEVSKTSSSEAYDMVCGGKFCSTAAAKWNKINQRMHERMAINFSGHPDIDFIRGMIPHHEGAVEMCDLLIEKLSCRKYTDVSELEGLVHFCNHVKREQDVQVEGMTKWLLERKKKTLNAGLSWPEAECSTNAKKNSHHHDHSSMGCGKLNAVSSIAFIKANLKMHSHMAVDLSCKHKSDFVRMMIPHHKGAVVMCEVLLDEESWKGVELSVESKPHDHLLSQRTRRLGHPSEADEYLVELCSNMTRVQRAEIVFMERWLTERKEDIHRPCGAFIEDKSLNQKNLICAGSGEKVFSHLNLTRTSSDKDLGSTSSYNLPLACEDTLPTSSFCHLPNGAVNDEFCTCEKVASAGHTCEGSNKNITSQTTLSMTLDCQRFCKKCPDNGKRPELFYQPCGACQYNNSYPYYCTNVEASIASPVGSAHKDFSSEGNILF